MQSFFRLFSILALTLVFGFSAKASHVPGGNITYECVGPNQFLITLTLFEDCGTAFTGNTSQTISINNDCGFPIQQLTLNNTIFQQEVSQLCPAQMGQSECSGGSLPGVWMHQWSAVVTLPGLCDSWTFSYTSCCRNTAVNSTTQDSYYWETVLNSQTAPCNNSAQITSQPIPYVCANQQVNFNMAALDPDGNTLVYSLIPAYSMNNTTNITYAGGYSGTAPIPGITINSATGQITFTPTTLGNFIVVVLIEEFDANGNLVGSVIQDFQFEVITCTNQVPSTPAGGVTNFTGSGVQTGPNSLQACEGDSFCFNLTFSDSDPTNVLTVTTSVQQIFPSATVNLSGTNPVTAQVCITVPSGAPATSVLSFDVMDDACPIPGINSYPVSLNVITSTYAGADEIICLGQGVQLNANGGSNFNWSVISGDPIVIGTNFSCNNCANPIANPAVTTTYQVTSNLSGGCNNIDTITVTVVPDFTYNLTQSSGTSCLQDPVTLNVTTSPSGGFTFGWAGLTSTANGFLSSTSGATTSVTATQPGTYNYAVTITSPGGCVKQDTLSIVVAAAYAPQVTATVDNDTIWCGDQVQLGVNLGGGVPAACGLSTSGGCSGPVTQTTVGTQTGVGTSTSYPSPYGHFYANLKQQYLFTAAELTAMGFVGGKINAISWQTTAQNGAQATFKNYKISMRCTNQTAMTATFATGLTTVWGPLDYTVTLGTNTHNFAVPYEWDGVSNLIVEICFDWWTQYSYTYNWSTPYTTTTFASTTYYNSDGIVACPQATGYTSMNRPRTTFHTCPSVPDPNNYTYSWTPSASVTSPSSQNTSAMPPNTTLYSVVVTDINGGCTDTATVNVFVDCFTCYAADPIVTNVDCYGASTGSIIANMVGTTGPWTVDWYNSGGTLLQSTPNVTNSDQLTGLPAGTYTITITDTSLCTRDTVVTITQPAAPLVANAGPDVVLCAGELLNINGAVTGGTTAYTINWNNGATTATQSFAPTASGCYDMSVVDANGCTAADTMCVTVNPIPVPTFVADNLGSCAPLNTNFTNTTDPTMVGSVNWNFGDGNTSANPLTVNHIYTTPSCYDVTLTVTSPAGCVADTTYNSYVCSWPYPVAGFLFGPQPTNLFNTGINFTNTSSSDAITFLYDFAGLATSTSPSPNYTFPNTTQGNYDVELIVSNAFGCYDTIVQTVIIDGIYTIYAPNAFTPDGDGKNDVFMVQGEGFDPNEFEFFIFNRWGELLFSSNSTSTGWDGTYRGQQAKGDVYVWKIKSKDSWTKERFETIGHVTLIR